ncbi:MAG: PssD/Cps14F family polysaccharide biosynthesis glycosyltransferase [Candidatus Methylomirabilales bacterium]
MKVCLVCSPGGHLRQLLRLLPVVGDAEYFFIVNNKIPLAPNFVGRTHFITKAHRDWRIVLNLIEAFRILRRERPDVIISTGAGCAVPVSLVGRLAFGCRILFIESFAAMERPSWTGRVMYWLAHRFAYQWEHQRRWYPKGVYGGQIF